MPPQANKNKRKHRKSGEKVSPKDKKYKSLHDFVSREKWQQQTTPQPVRRKWIV